MCKYCDKLKDYVENRLKIDVQELCEKCAIKMLIIEINSLTRSIKDILVFQKENKK